MTDNGVTSEEHSLGLVTALISILLTALILRAQVDGFEREHTTIVTILKPDLQHASEIVELVIVMAAIVKFCE